MTPAMRLQQLKHAVQRRRIGLVLAFSLPWWLLACALAWRWHGGVAWLLPALVAGASIAFATRYANAIDAQWLSRALDLQRRDMEDSAALLFADAATLPPLARLQRMRLESRVGIDPAPDLRPRWPVRVSATVRMQSPARDRDAAEARSDEPLTGEPLGRGEVDGSSAFEPIPVERINPDGAGPTEDGSADRAPGFLKIGADRLGEPPGMCAAP